jgi:uncharacterized protein (TIGR04255 family)
LLVSYDGEMGEAVLSEALPSFENPPVVEVAVGVHFLQLPGLNTIALGRLAEMWRARYPVAQEQPALPPMVPGGGPMITFQLQTSLPPLRLWLLTEDESSLVQVQHDRLLVNWRQVNTGDPYPRYRVLRKDFTALWSEFERYLAAADYGVLQPSLAEVSFFNRIAIGAAGELPGIVTALNPGWALDGQSATSLQLEREVRGPSGEAQGNQNIALGYRRELGFAQMEISTRVRIDAESGDDAAILNALDAAHHAGVLTFDEITTESAHAAWGKHDASAN